ncbi:hypothetical protein IRZ70_11680 [Pseudomonas monteilii]|nr:hypothetical protein [Pseudomonas monteilii]
MIWIYIIIFVTCLVITGLLGLTVGIHYNPSSTIRFVPNWGSWGDWFSGGGALLAVITTLYLSRRDERQRAAQEHDRFEIEQGASSSHIAIRFTSLGHFNAKVKSVLISRPDGRSITMFGHDPSGTEAKMPVYLHFKDDLQYEWNVRHMRQLLMAINSLQCARLDDLAIEVITSVDVFRFSFDGPVLKALREAAKRESISVEALF